MPGPRRTGWLRRLLFALGLWLPALLSPVPAPALEIWFAPTDNLPRHGVVRNRDFPDLFAEPPGWNTRIDVFQIAPYFAARGDDAALRQIAAFAKRHGFQLAAGVQPTQVQGECDMGVRVASARPKTAPPSAASARLASPSAASASMNR